ncbi:hypothetical protein DITRI_Ditri05aG0035600 [Diplodiscus trichospermus]
MRQVVEVYTSPSAPLKGVDELFSAIPEEGRRKAYTEALAKAKTEEEAKIAAGKLVKQLVQQEAGRGSEKAFRARSQGC